MISGNAFADAAIYTFGLQIIGFTFASILKTEIFYDIFGGCNFLLLVFVGGFPSSTNTNSVDDSATKWSFPGPEVFAVLFIISRGWLLIFLAFRAHSRKGDARFNEVIHKPLVFLIYWMVQATWVYIISLPLMAVQQRPLLDGTTIVSQILPLIGFAFSIFLEVSSDIQKIIWVQNGRIGGFCQVGWWKYSRHPNYAGEILQWWFACIYSILSTGSIIGILSPLYTMYILLALNGTGIMNAEGQNLKRYYEAEEYCDLYEQYRLKTSPLFPIIGYEFVPKQLKRILFFELKAYEYRPDDRQVHYGSTPSQLDEEERIGNDES